MASETKSVIPEAVASVTYTIRTKSGFNALFTVRDVSGMDLLAKMELIEKEFEAQQIVPQPERSFGTKKPLNIVPGEKCPLCTSPLVESTTSNGSKMIKCSTQKYDFATKTVSGCPYTRWVA